MCPKYADFPKEEWDNLVGFNIQAKKLMETASLSFFEKSKFRSRFRRIMKAVKANKYAKARTNMNAFILDLQFKPPK
jgi:hypothetical protein